MEDLIINYWPQVVMLVTVAAMWGDTRRKIQGLTDQVTKQNGRVGKLEDSIGGEHGLRERIKGLEVEIEND